MEKLFFSEFEALSKADWLQQIQNELKSGSLEKFYTELNGLKKDPFAHYSDGMEWKSPLFRSSHSDIIKIGAKLQHSNNESVLSLLNTGVNAPWLVFPGGSGKTEIANILKDVQLDILFPVFEVSDKKTLNSLFEFLKTFDHKTQSRFIIRLTSHAFDFQDGWNNNGNGFVINQLDEEKSDLKADNAPIERLTRILMKFYDTTIMKTNHRDWKKTAILLNIGTSFMMELCTLRALRILLSNLSKALYTKVESQPLILCQTDQDCLSTDENKNLLINSSVALCTSIAGADFCFLNQKTEEAYDAAN